MKKRILLFTSVAAMAVISLTSGNNGAGAQKNYDCTGAETGLGNVVGCSASGCHGASATAGITVALELDSAGVAQHYYTPGATYQVKITGTNTTSTTLPVFGFQVTCIKGSTSVATPVNAGTFASSGLPTNVRYTPPSAGNFVCSFIEHSNPITATTLGGATGGTYVESFNWTAPVAGTGTVSFWGALNACNGTGTESGDHWNTKNITVTEGRSSILNTQNISESLSIKAFPNPVVNSLNLQFDNAHPGTYSVLVTDMAGRTIYRASQDVSSSTTTSISTANWMPGVYQVIVDRDGNRKVISVVK